MATFDEKGVGTEDGGGIGVIWVARGSVRDDGAVLEEDVRLGFGGAGHLRGFAIRCSMFLFSWDPRVDMYVDARSFEPCRARRLRT